MIGDFRTAALHEGLARAPIEDDTLIALLILAFAGINVTVATGSSDNPYGHADCSKHAARLIDGEGKLAFDRDTLQQVARSVLIDVMSCRRNRSDSGITARIAGEVIGADQFLSNTATEQFLSCLSRSALEAAAEASGVAGRIRAKDTRAALVEHFSEGRFVHPEVLIAPAPGEVARWAVRYMTSSSEPEAEENETSRRPESEPDALDKETEFQEAAE
ncbi:hypothetical protein SAMN05216328_1259 [Ensifer sp. YR511]|nr:hypothetical protein SAMN05216328_1259 [Ensifer sp. YR511]